MHTMNKYIHTYTFYTYTQPHTYVYLFINTYFDYKNLKIKSQYINIKITIREKFRTLKNYDKILLINNLFLEKLRNKLANEIRMKFEFKFNDANRMGNNFEVKLFIKHFTF